jgi:hypothetical protein
MDGVAHVIVNAPLDNVCKAQGILGVIYMNLVYSSLLKCAHNIKTSL